MRSEGDESGIAYWKRKERVIFKEEMFSMGAILMKLAVFLKENVSRHIKNNFSKIVISYLKINLFLIFK